MKLGLWGARADQGGLAAMTWEFWRWMRPTKTMVVVLPKGRGEARLDRYPQRDRSAVWMNYGYDDALTETAVRRFCDGLDVVYAAETFYAEPVAGIMRECGVRTVLHAMPELWRGEETMSKPDVVWAPTNWELDRLPERAEVVPVPVDRSRFRTRVSSAPDRPLTFLFSGAPAFHDRNGLLLAVDALAYVRQPCKVIFAGTPDPPPDIYNTHRTPVSVEWHPGGVENYWDRYTADIDALLIPRRYAGLSLPMQEAAAAGLPIVTLDLPPQNQWVSPDTLVPAKLYRQVEMVNGRFWVHTADPKQIAEAMDRLADPVTYAGAHWTSWDRAAGIGWDVLEPVYREKLEAVAAG